MATPEAGRLRIELEDAKAALRAAQQGQRDKEEEPLDPKMLTQDESSQAAKNGQRIFAQLTVNAKCITKPENLLT